MIDNIEKTEDKESKSLKDTKVDNSFLDTLSDAAETTIEIITNIIKD